MRKTFKVAILVLMSFSLFSGAVSSRQAINHNDPISVQDEGNLPYDEWYGPDDTLDNGEDGRTDSVVIPEAPENDAREAPEEDTRPQAR